MKAHTTARDLAMIAVFAGITAVLGLVPAIPVGPVPITAQSFGVILAGAILGARRGGASQLLLLALVAIGLPLLAGGRGGLGVFMGATVGFLIGWPLVAFAIGWLTERVGAPYSVIKGLIINALCGIGLLYVLGIAGMLLRTSMSLQAAIIANLPFLIGDSIKVVLATLIAAGVHKAYPGLLPFRGRAAQASVRKGEPVRA